MSKAQELYGRSMMRLSELERTGQGATPQAEVYRDRMERLKSMFPNLSGSFMGGISAMALPPSMRPLETPAPADGVIVDEASYQAELRRSKMLDGMAAAEIPGVDTHGKDDGCPIDGIIFDEASYQAELRRSRRLTGLA